MSDGTIAALIYILVLCILLVVSGFVAEKFNYDKDEKDGLITASVIWPISIFAIPIFCTLRFAYKAGKFLAGKM